MIDEKTLNRNLNKFLAKRGPSSTSVIQFNKSIALDIIKGKLNYKIVAKNADIKVCNIKYKGNKFVGDVILYAGNIIKNSICVEMEWDDNGNPIITNDVEKQEDYALDAIKLLIVVPSWATLHEGDIIMDIDDNMWMVKSIDTTKEMIDAYFGLDVNGKQLIGVDFNANRFYAQVEVTNKLVKYLSEIINKKYMDFFKKYHCDKMYPMFKLFERIIVKNDDTEWFVGLFSHIDEDGNYCTAGGGRWKYAKKLNKHTIKKIGQ